MRPMVKNISQFFLPNRKGISGGMDASPVVTQIILNYARCSGQFSPFFLADHRMQYWPKLKRRISRKKLICFNFGHLLNYNFVSCQHGCNS